MTSNKSISKKSLVKWFLEEKNPSVRNFTLRDLLNRREDDPELRVAKAVIPNSKITKRVFSKQKPEGYWEEPANPYILSTNLLTGK